LNKLDFDFDPNARAPRFEKFVEECWTDANAHLLMEEMMGDVTLPDERLKVFFILFGVPDAGKSVWEQIFEFLVGGNNKCAMHLDDFAQHFGMEEAMGKKLILLAEAAKGIRNGAKVVEQIKRITGDDLIPVHRKNKPTVSARWPTKIVAVSNHLLGLVDESAALFNRAVPVAFTNAIPREKQDRQLPAKLRKEAPGIMMLALNGWKRLHDNGYFTMPQTSEQLLSDLRLEGAPLQVWIERECVLASNAWTATDVLFDAYRDFCQLNGATAVEKNEFGKALKAAAPATKSSRQTDNGAQKHGYKGIHLK
jgi:P4 family phage/plasmid primase-like protien